MPVIALYALVVLAFIVDQLSSFFDAHWKVAEFSFQDPLHLGITLFWGAVIIWVLSCIKRRKPHTPKTFFYFWIISIIFLLLEMFESGAPRSILFTFQGLELLIWFICYRLCDTNQQLKDWFACQDTGCSDPGCISSPPKEEQE